MLVDDNGNLSGIIDWGDVNIGHPACDLSIAYSYLPPASRADFYDIYGEVDEETKILARMIAVYIPMLIFMQAIDDKDEAIAYWKPNQLFSVPWPYNGSRVMAESYLIQKRSLKNLQAFFFVS